MYKCTPRMCILYCTPYILDYVKVYNKVVYIVHLYIFDYVQVYTKVVFNVLYIFIY